MLCFQTNKLDKTLLMSISFLKIETVTVKSAVKLSIAFFLGFLRLFAKCQCVHSNLDISVVALLSVVNIFLDPSPVTLFQRVSVSCNMKT